MTVQFSPQRNPRVIIIQKLYGKLFNNEENITFPKHRFKKFIKDISKNNDSKLRIGGTVASSIYMMTQGVQILRVHDVNEIMQGIKVYKEIIKN